MCLFIKNKVRPVESTPHTAILIICHFLIYAFIVFQTPSLHTYFLPYLCVIIKLSLFYTMLSHIL